MERVKSVSGNYVPGTYARRIPNGRQMAEEKLRNWERQRSNRPKGEKAPMAPAICISRKIGVGALEIADRIADRSDYRVVDREIIEHIANRAELREKTVAFFDEKYPGRTAEFMTFLFGEKSFTRKDYARQLAETVFAIANLEPTIFVGRGAHLILPRDRALAVRFICSDERRTGRLCQVSGMEIQESRLELKRRDKEQREFFKQVYGTVDASPYEFDLVINCDHVPDPGSAAAIVIRALEEKFGRPTGPATGG